MASSGPVSRRLFDFIDFMTPGVEAQDFPAADGSIGIDDGLRSVVLLLGPECDARLGRSEVGDRIREDRCDVLCRHNLRQEFRVSLMPLNGIGREGQQKCSSCQSVVVTRTPDAVHSRVASDHLDRVALSE